MVKKEFTTEELVKTIVSAIDDKKGQQITSLDLRATEGAVCNAFVICNADSTTQVAAIADGIEQKVREELGEKPHRVEGTANALWIAMDYFDVMVHIFTTELRNFYKLEQLWADAPATHYNL